MPKCENCGTFVTPAFARVFGDNTDHVFACTDCAPARALYEGRATGGPVEWVSAED